MRRSTRRCGRFAKVKRDKYIRTRKSKKGVAYQVSVPYDSPEGRRWITKTFSSWDYPRPQDALADARRYRDKTLHDAVYRRISLKSPTVEYFYKQKWNYFPKALNTRKKHDAIFASCFAEYRARELATITTPEIQKSLTERAKTHASDGVKRLLTVWRQIYRTALLEGYNIIDLTTSVEIPKSRIAPKTKQVTITAEQFAEFLDHLLEYNSAGGVPQKRNVQVWYMLVIMYYCGCRPSEVLALSKSDVDLNAREISITKAVGSNYTERCVLIPAKTAQSVRQCPIPDALVPHLENLIASVSGEYLFTDDNGNYLDIDKLSDLIHRVSKSRGIPFNAYMLRHLYATDLVKHTDARTAQDLLGHASFNMTLDYARSSRDDREKAVKDRTLPTSCQLKKSNDQQ